jgi:hypothetical protein
MNRRYLPVDSKRLLNIFLPISERFVKALVAVTQNTLGLDVDHRHLR